jgi:hypothetical protein
VHGHVTAIFVLIHVLIIGAAAFAAMRAYEKHQKEGKPPNHQLAKEMLAGLAGGEVSCRLHTHNWHVRKSASSKCHIMCNANGALQH